MADPHSILLVPTEGDPHGLLREWPCGARAPMAHYFECVTHGGGWKAQDTRLSPGYGLLPTWPEDKPWFCGTCGERCPKDRNRRALVLAWEERAHPLGFMALVVAAQGIPLPKGRRWWLRPNPSMTGMVATALLAEEMKMGRAVLLGADGREMVASPRERGQIIARAVERLGEVALTSPARTPADTITDPQPGDIVDGCEVKTRNGDWVIYLPPSRSYLTTTGLSSWRSWARVEMVQHVANRSTDA